MEPFKAAVILFLVTALSGGQSELHRELESQNFENIESRSLHDHSIRKREIGDDDETSHQTDDHTSDGTLNYDEDSSQKTYRDSEKNYNEPAHNTGINQGDSNTNTDSKEGETDTLDIDAIYHNTVGQDENYDQTTDAFYQNLDYTGDIKEGDTDTSDGTFGIAEGEPYISPNQMLDDDYSTMASNPGGGNENIDAIHYNNYDQTMDALNQKLDYEGEFTEGDTDTFQNDLGKSAESDSGEKCNTCGGKTDLSKDGTDSDSGDEAGTGSDTGDEQTCKNCGGKGDSASGETSYNPGDLNRVDTADKTNSESGEVQSCSTCGGDSDTDRDETESDSKDGSRSQETGTKAGEKGNCNKCGSKGENSERETGSNSGDRGESNSGGDKTDSDSGDEQDCNKCGGMGDIAGDRTRSDSDDRGEGNSDSDDESNDSDDRRSCNNCGGKRETTEDVTESDSSNGGDSYSGQRRSSNSGEKRNCNKCGRKGGNSERETGSNLDDRGGSDSVGDKTDSDSGDEQDCNRCGGMGDTAGDGTRSDSGDGDSGNSDDSSNDSKDAEQEQSGMKLAETTMNDIRRDNIDKSYINIPGSISSSTSEWTSLDTKDRFVKKGEGIPIQPDSSWQNPSSYSDTTSNNAIQPDSSWQGSSTVTDSNNFASSQSIAKQPENAYDAGLITGSSDRGISELITTGRDTGSESGKGISSHSENIFDTGVTSLFSTSVAVSPVSNSNGGNINTVVTDKTSQNQEPTVDSTSSYADSSKSSGGYVDLSLNGKAVESSDQGTGIFVKSSNSISKTGQGIPGTPDSSRTDSSLATGSKFSEMIQDIAVQTGNVGLSVDTNYGPVETIYSEQVNYIPTSPDPTFIKSEQTPGMESTSVLTSIPIEPSLTNYMKPSVPGGSIVESNTRNANQYIPNQQEPQGINLKFQGTGKIVQGVPSALESTITESTGSNVDSIIVDTISQNLEPAVRSTANLVDIPASSGGYVDLSLNGKAVEKGQPGENVFIESNGGVQGQTDVSWQSPSIDPEFTTFQPNQGIPVDSSATYVDNSVSPGGYIDMHLKSKVVEAQQPGRITLIESSTGVPVQTDISWQNPSPNPEFKPSLASQGTPIESSATYVDNSVSAGGYVDMSLKSKVVEVNQPGENMIIKSNSGSPVQTDLSWQNPTANADYKTSRISQGSSAQSLSSLQGSSTITDSSGFVDLSLKGKGKIAKDNKQQVQGIAVGNYVKEPYVVKSWSDSTKSKGTHIAIPDGAIDIAGRIEQQMGSTASRYTLNRDPQAFINEPRVITLNGTALKKKPSKIFLAITSKIREADGASAYQYLKDNAKQVENPAGGFIKIYRNQPGGSKEMQRVYVNFRQPSAVVKKRTLTRTIDIPGNMTRVLNTGQGGSVTIDVGDQRNNFINVRHSSPVVRKSTFTRTWNVPGMQRRVFNTGTDGSVSIGFGGQTDNTAEYNGISSRLTGSTAMSINNIGVHGGHANSNYGHGTHTTYVEGQPLFGSVGGKMIKTGGEKVNFDHGHAHDEHTINVAEVSLPTGHFHVHSDGGQHIVHNQRHENVNEVTYKKVMDIINRRKAMKSGSVSLPVDSSISTVRKVTQVGANSGIGRSLDRQFSSGSVQFKEVSLPTSFFHVHTDGNRHIVHNQRNEIVDPATYKSVMDILKRRRSSSTSRPFDSSFFTSRSAAQNVGVTGIPIHI